MKTDLPMTSVDELGMLLAQIATLTARADQIKDTLKDAATAGDQKVFDGAMFRAAVVEANRLNEMVWSMDVQIGKLNDGLKQAIRGEETVARIEQIVPDKSTPIVMYCQAGGRSAMACSILQQLGYNCVANGGGVGGLALRLQRDIRRGGS